MELLIEKLKNLNLNDTEIDGYLNNIFSYKEKNIKVIGTVDDPWFKAKNLLEILGYPKNRITQNKILQKMEPSLKSKFCEVEYSKYSTYNEGKEIYVNEPGLYYLIMKSKLNSAKSFQMYVYKKLLPSIRKLVKKRYEEEINKRDYKIKELIFENSSKIEKMEIENEELNVKFHEILQNRNINPKNSSLNHQYILFKNKLFSNEYMFIRGQDKYIKNKKKIYKTEFEISIDQTKTPNPIDLINRLKEKIQIINEKNLKLEELKMSSNYLNAK